MLNRIIEFSLKNRLFVLAGAALLFVYGVFTLIGLPVDVLPDLNRPTVTIFLEAEGLAPEEVETLVNFPVETVLNGAPGVKRVRSNAAVGLGLIFVEFDWGTDIFLDRQIVSEKLQLATERLPAGVTPIMGPISSVMGQIMLIGLQSDSVSAMELRSLADWTLRPRLLTIPGVAQVIPIGGEVRQYQVLVSPEKLKAFGLSLSDVREALENSNSNTTGGFIQRRKGSCYR